MTEPLHPSEHKIGRFGGLRGSERYVPRMPAGAPLDAAVIMTRSRGGPPMAKHDPNREEESF
jgi:hypothetical protein